MGNLLKIWGKCLLFIKDNVSDSEFNAWFKPIVPLKLVNDVLTLQVNSSFVFEYLETNYIDILRKTIRKEIGSNAKLEYSIQIARKNSSGRMTLPGSNQSAVRNPSVKKHINFAKGNKEIPSPFIIPGIKDRHVPTQLNHKSSFDTFIEGECNRLAVSAGMGIANKPGATSFNPLYIHGQVGLGKTHLVNAIGLKIKENHPNLLVLYVRADQFYSQFIDSVKNNNQNDFIYYYQMLDVLIIDDVHNLIKKEKTQDVLFQIFNHLHQNGKQIIFTSDKSPADMDMTPRLVSRFRWGLADELKAPDFETRRAIAESLIYNEGAKFEDDIIDYVAMNVNTNVRELQGVLLTLMAQQTINKEITMDLVVEIIERLINNSKQQITIDFIQKIICTHFGLTKEMLNSKTRKRQVVQARQLAMFFSKKYTESSLAKIGFHCGNKDHATVLHACKTINNLLETDKKFASDVIKIEEKLKI